VVDADNGLGRWPVFAGADAMSSSYDRERKIDALGTGIRLVVASILIFVPIVEAGFAPWDLIGALVVFLLMAVGIDRLLSGEDLEASAQ
jgi:hypothetical protein